MTFQFVSFFFLQRPRLLFYHRRICCRLGHLFFWNTKGALLFWLSSLDASVKVIPPMFTAAFFFPSLSFMISRTAPGVIVDDPFFLPPSAALLLYISRKEREIKYCRDWQIAAAAAGLRCTHTHIKALVDPLFASLCLHVANGLIIKKHRTEH